MIAVVVPFRSGGKSRLPAEVRVQAALAMLGDVLEVAAAGGERVRLVTDDPAASGVARALGVEIVTDPGGGQGQAVSAGLSGIDGACLVLNADVPRVERADLTALAASALAGAVAIVAAEDGTTNALALPSTGVFEPLYGAGSASRFAAHASALGLEVHDLDVPRLRDDVDSVDDLERIASLAGPRTRALATVLRV